MISREVQWVRGYLRHGRNNVLHRGNVKVTVVEQGRAMILDGLKGLALDPSW